MASQVVIGGTSSPGTTPPAPSDFNFNAADENLKPKTQHRLQAAPLPPLGVLSNFNGSFNGNGFNTIFRPNAVVGATFPNDAVLELNLTTETLSFSKSIGNVPNRGFGSQSDVFLNGVPYVQRINDSTNLDTGKADAAKPVGIHFEPGLWMHMPATASNPQLAESLVRMGSIPHGTTINAQALAPTTSTAGPPQIPSVDITPFIIGGGGLVKFPSQTAADSTTSRLPQDLSLFIENGTITQAMLDDPNVVLRNANTGKTIIENIHFTVSTQPSAPELGGGVANIGFLQGDLSGGPNANAIQMSATFWISTLEDSSIQIQYSQTVFLNFNGLTWPHVSSPIYIYLPATL